MTTRSTFAAVVCSSLLLAAALCLAQQPELLPSTPVKTGAANYGKLPLLFEKNQGQTDPSVKFLSNGSGYTVFLTSGGMVLSLRPSEVSNPDSFKPVTPVAANTRAAAPTPVAATEAKPASTVMSFTLVGANKNPEVVGENLQPTKVNYFIGNDRSKWQTNVSTYGQVRYKNVYPGVDLVYYGNNRQVEYDFDVAPNADPSKIQFDVKGADSLAVDAEGDLVLKKGAGELHFQAPVVYQQIKGQRTKVAGNYSVAGSGRVGFTLASHDPGKPLVIDPVLSYSTYLGGRNDENASGIAIDAAGDAYVVGGTTSPDFPLAVIGPFNPTQYRIFLAKLDVSGTTLLWADYICGTSGNDYAEGIALDAQNNSYITGQAYSSDFPTVNPYQSTMAGNTDGFVSKVSADGSTLLYSTYLGGTNWDNPTSVVVDSSNEPIIAGYTNSTDYPVANAFQSTVQPNQYNNYGDYGFISKFSADGASLVFSTYVAGSQTNCTYYCSPYSEIYNVGLDGIGNIYVAGRTDTTDFPVSQGAYLPSNPTVNNYYSTTGFVSSFTPSGALNYSTYFGGTTYTWLYAMDVDASGNTYLTGNAPADGSFPITNTSICDPSVSSCDAAYVAKLNSTGTTLLYSTFLGPNNSTEGHGIKVDSNGNAYVLTYFGNGSYNLVNPIQTYTGNGGVLIDEIDATAGTELFSTYLGGSNGTNYGSLALDSSQSIYVTGQTYSQDFPVLQSGFQSSSGGQNDVYISKITQVSAPAFTISPSLLQYSTLTVGMTSAPRSALIRNMGTAPLNIATKQLTGDFAETDDCGSLVPPAGTCTFTVTFTPTAPGSRFGTILLGDDAAGSPHFINLVGNGSSPVVVLSPTSLSFASAAVNSTSAPQTVTLSNTGNATLNISNIQMSGDYAQTNNCPPALGLGSSCEFQITFTPTTGGTRNGSLTLTDDAPDSPETIALSGSGFVTTGTVSPGSLSFSNQNVGSSSPAQVVTVTNTGGNVMTVSGVLTSGNFSQTNNCSSVAANGGTCTISVSFAPTTSGSQTGTLTINDNAQGNPHLVSLSGTGLAGTANLNSTSMTFGQLNVGASSAAQTLTITNTGNGPLTMSSIQVTGDFAETNNCSTVAPSTTCAVQITFTPTSSGTRTGSLIITSSAIGGPQSVSLSGSGIDFNMPANGGTSTVKAGATATYQLDISPVGGSFSNAISLKCAGVPAFATCTISPASVTPGANASTVTVTVATKASTSGALEMPGAHPPIFATLWMTNGLGIFGVLLFGNGNRKSKRSWFVLLGLVLMMAIVLAGCGGSSTTASNPAPPASSGTPVGSYTVIVIGTSGSATHFSSLSLTVQ